MPTVGAARGKAGTALGTALAFAAGPAVTEAGAGVSGAAGVCAAARAGTIEKAAAAAKILRNILI
jgi:hypothetical protein